MKELQKDVFKALNISSSVLRVEGSPMNIYEWGLRKYALFPQPPKEHFILAMPIFQ